MTRVAWLSIAAAVVTMALKALAYVLAGSVGLLADALESLGSPAGVIMALSKLRVAACPADEDHPYGNGAAENFSAGFEAALILIAAASVADAAVQRLFHPRPFARLGLGLAVLLLAALVNRAVTGWLPLDSMVAIAVAANIVWRGRRIVRESVYGPMDAAPPVKEQAPVRRLLETYVGEGVQYHAFRTRRSGARRFIALPPPRSSWTWRRSVIGPP